MYMQNTKVIKKRLEKSHISPYFSKIPYQKYTSSAYQINQVYRPGSVYKDV